MKQLSSPGGGRMLTPGEVHLYLLRQEEAADAALISRYLSLLTEEEEARRARYHFERNRHEFLLTRALARTTLSRYAPVAPEDWRFKASAHGRPEVVSPVFPFSFNLSNTQGLIACAVSLHPEVGVDVENHAARVNSLEVADRYFSSREVASLRALDPSQQHERFFTYWTLKEAYLKARGVGLGLPLDQFTLLLEEGEEDSARIEFHAGLADDPRGWQFARLRPSPAHLAAVAVRTDGCPLRLSVQWVIP